MFDIVQSLVNLWETTGIYQMLFTDGQLDIAFVKTVIMLAVSGVLIYLAIGKGFEPLLLLPIAFGMLLANLPGGGVFHMDFFFDEYYIAFEKTVIDGVESINSTGAYSHMMEAFLAKLNDGEDLEAFSL